MIRLIVVFCSLILSISLLAVPVRGELPAEWVKENVAALLPLYKHFHCHPELSLHERETSLRLAEELRGAGAEVTTGIGGWGVVGMMRNGDGPLLLLRTDMDALPITEATGLDYASKVAIDDPDGTGKVGVMHACGHDVHMTNLVGVARFLGGHKRLWRGTVMFVGQPAEERVQGAKAMLDVGLYERFGKPDYALGMHVAPAPAGQIGYCPGYAMANVDGADITVRGVGGHGAYPHTTVDPVVQAAQLILALQTIVSREIVPTEPAVITVGSIHAGTKHNIIPNECKLQLTIRSYSPEVREQLRDAITLKAKGIALTAGAPEPTVKFSEGTNAVYNQPELVDRLVPVFQRVLGTENVSQKPPVMGAEDFGLYSRGGVPIFFVWVGSISPERLAALDRQISLHSPLYYPDAQETLTASITAMSAAALELLPP